MTRERISHILKLREMLLLFQTGFSLVNVAVVCAILESISDLDHFVVFLRLYCTIEMKTKSIIEAKTSDTMMCRSSRLTFRRPVTKQNTTFLIWIDNRYVRGLSLDHLIMSAHVSSQPKSVAEVGSHRPADGLLFSANQQLHQGQRGQRDTAKLKHA